MSEQVRRSKNSIQIVDDRRVLPENGNYIDDSCEYVAVVKTNRLSSLAPLTTVHISVAISVTNRTNRSF